MQAATLVVLLLLGQSPAEPAADERVESPAEQSDLELATLLLWGNRDEPLPDLQAVRRALSLEDLDLTSLREQANALRLTLADAAAQDAGRPDEDDERRVLQARLTVIERLIEHEVLAAEAHNEQRRQEEQAARQRANEDARRADAARARALEEARKARSALVEQAYARVAELEGLNARLAHQKGEVQSTTAKLVAEVREAGEDAARLLSLAKAPGLAPADADGLFRDVSAKQKALLAGVGFALDARRTLPPVVEEVARARAGALEDAARLASALGSGARDDVQRAVDALRAVVISLEEELAALESDTSERWYRVAERRLEVAKLLGEVRLTLARRLSPELHSQLRALSDESAENFDVAMRQLFWDLRFHVERRAYDVRHLGERLSDGIELGRIVWALCVAFIVVMLSFWVWRRAPAVFERTKKSVLRSAQSPAYARFLGSWLNLIEAIAPRAFLLVLCVWLHRVLTPVAPEPELTIVVEIAVWVLSYQLASRLLHMLILRLVRRRLALSVVQKLQVLRSVRLVLRYGFVVGYFLDVTGRLVGHGMLYEGVRVLAFVGALPIFAVLVQRWRDDIADAYLAHQPDSRLARAVEQARDRWYGFFVAVAAFGVVAARGSGMLGRDFVLGFEQSRKALAYLFRLRIERQAQRRGLPPVDIGELPEAVREAFPDAPTDRERLLVDRFAALPAALDLLRRFPDGGPGSLVITSPWGVGRSTWLQRLTAQIDDEREPLWWTPSERVTTAAGLCASLGGALGRTEPPENLRALCAALVESERPRVVILDGLERLFLRAQGGYAAVDAFTELMERTRGRVFWLLASAGSAFRHLEQTRAFDQHVGGVVTLSRWSEAEIRELIQRRQRASGIAASFEDLIVHAVEGDRLPTQVVETEEGYIRLLWNFAEGNPRVAQLFWLRSLYRTSSGELRVRLYSAPSADDLELLVERERFVLSAFHLHGALTPEEAAVACRLPVALVRAHVARAVTLGLYEEAPPGSGRYAISLAWWAAALRYLRRKNLLSSEAEGTRWIPTTSNR